MSDSEESGKEGQITRRREQFFFSHLLAELGGRIIAAVPKATWHKKVGKRKPNQI